MATLQESLPPEILEYLQGMKGKLPNGYPAPSPLSAADSASVFVDSGQTPYSGAEAFETAGKELVPSGPRSVVPSGPSPLTGAAEKGVIELGDESVRHLPQVIEGAESAMPAVIPKSGLPALLEKAGLIGADGGILGAAGKIAGKAALPLAVAQTALDGPESATASPMDGPVPGQPGKYFKGQDIVDGPVPPTGMAASLGSRHGDDTPPPSDPASAERVVASAGPSDDEEDATSPAVKAATSTVAPTAAPGSPAPINPILAAFLQSKKEMAGAQEAASYNRQLNGIAEAASQMGHAISRAPGEFDHKGFQSLRDNANAPVTDLQTKSAAGMAALQSQKALMDATKESDAMNPKSSASVAFRKAVERLSPKLVEQYGDKWADVTAADGDAIWNYVKLKETIDGRREDNKLKLEQIKATKEAAMTDKQRAADEKTQLALSKSIDVSLASGRSPLGLAAKVNNNMDRAIDVASRKDASWADMAGVASDTASALSGGQATLSASEHQAYHTLDEKMKYYTTLWTNKPQAADVPEIKAHIISIAKDMQKVSNNVIGDHLGMAWAGVDGPTGWKSRHPLETKILMDHLAGGYKYETVPGAATTSAAPAPAPSSSTPGPASVPPKPSATSAHGHYAPGRVVTIKGSQYVVGADGDSLTPVVK